MGNIELELYLISKTVKSSVSSCGQVHLDGEQVLLKFSDRKLLPFSGSVLTVTIIS